MSVKGELQRIDATIDEVFEPGQREKLRRTAKSQRKGYLKGLQEAKDVAGEPAMRALGEWIRDEIRHTGKPPSGRQVRKQGAAICRDHGHEVSINDWLGS